MLTEDRSSRGALAEQIVGLLAPDDPESPLCAFARAYLRRVPDQGMPDLPPDQLAAEVSGVYELLDARSDEPVVLRVFTPTLERDGYEASGSVVEFVTDDTPFLVDSVTMLLTREGLGVERLFHPVVGTVRGEGGRIERIVPAREARKRESVQHYDLDAVLDEEQCRSLEGLITRVLRNVRNTVRDFHPMQDAVRKMIALAVSARGTVSNEEIDEAVDFFTWLLEDNIVFLGYREYAIEGEGEDRAVSVVPNSGLGILAEVEDSRYAEPIRLADLQPELAKRFTGTNLLTITKTNQHSRVHRDARMDYISVRTFDRTGRANGEARLLGLLTSKAYMAEAAKIPVVAGKLESILGAEDLIEGSHDYKAAIQLFESFPLDELLSASADDLRTSIVGLLEHEEQQQVRLFLRRDPLNRNVVVLVVVPRGRFNAGLRQQLQELFLARLRGNAVDYRLSLDESGDARIHFTVWVDPGTAPQVEYDQLESEVLALTRTWEDRVAGELAGIVGEHEAERIVEAWGSRFPQYYKDSTELGIAVGDVLAVERLAGSDRALMVAARNEREGDEHLTRIAVYHKRDKLDLSHMMPVLENIGLRVIEEVPTRVRAAEHILIHDFGVLGPDGAALDLDRCGERICAAIEAALLSEAESDRLHRLLVTTSLDHHQLAILRAYRAYWRLVTKGYTPQYMGDALSAHPPIAENLVLLFEARFGPEADPSAEAAVRAAIRHDLEAVATLDEDRILRGFQGLIDATVRTNAFLPDRPALSFKIRSSRVPEMPAPTPLFEIFVYGPAVEGVHLRGGAVSRGGIRWSIRREDYRTEVLGLMKAQMTKNAVIVPDGAKGGFIVRSTGDPTYEDVTASYETFIRGLLDVTDNLVGGEVVHPEGVVVHDGPDPYLVVAADRGTAKLSDNANAIAAEYGFWLGDAFASGGSHGYDHKKLGITARGAWESVKRHFSDLEIDLDTHPITVVGIGDMSGDVFGNGMLLSDTIRLVAAFDHRDIFVDPDPDPAASYAERSRLFALARSSWQDYDTAALSTGGAVYSRAAKSITISQEAAEAFGIERREMTPNELISALLTAPVDLLWNGGIGTYVKSRHETNEQVQDRANDGVRVDGAALRCKVVGEGGNLGFTQAGRIEFERVAGGRIFTDFIDNAGGVHCSDREVNLKILLNLAIERGDLDPADRDRLVDAVAPNVVAAVVYDNYLQAQILSQSAERSARRVDVYEDLMVDLEGEGLLDRAIERLPSGEEIAERSRNGQGMARPELAVLLAYAKRSLTVSVLASDLPDWDHFDEDLLDYFPGPVVERFGHLVADFPLRRELVATIAANQVVNSIGTTFVSRLESETGATAPEVVRAYRIARAVTGASDRWATLESLEGVAPADVQRELLAGVDELVELTTRWFVSEPSAVVETRDIEVWAAAFRALSEEIADVGPETWREEREAAAEELAGRGVPADLARRHVFQMELVHGPDIIDVATKTGRPVLDVARVFFRMGQAFRIDWLEAQTPQLPARTRWERWSVQTLEDELLRLRRNLVERVFAEADGRGADDAIEAFVVAHAAEEGRLVRFMRMLARDGVNDAASMVVAIRQLRSLVG